MKYRRRSVSVYIHIFRILYCTDSVELFSYHTGSYLMLECIQKWKILLHIWNDYMVIISYNNMSLTCYLQLCEVRRWGFWFWHGVLPHFRRSRCTWLAPCCLVEEGPCTSSKPPCPWTHCTGWQPLFRIGKCRLWI